MTAKKLFIIDGMAMAFRSHHAFSQRPLTTKEGFPTSAVFGCASFLIKLIEKERPDYLVLAADTKGPNFRHRMYPEYKAHRKPMPEELAQQLTVLNQLYGLLGMPILAESDYEADDLIGSLVDQLGSDSLHCYIVSGDKDFLQLIDEKTFLYSPKKGGEIAISDREAVKAKFNCEPQQVIDVLAIMGDSADNVPGVPGIGEKGATQLIDTYSSLENAIEQAENIANKRQQKALIAGQEMGRLSKRLVTIKKDIPLHVSLEDLVCKVDWESQEILEFFTAYELHTLKNRAMIKLHGRKKVVEEKPQDPQISVKPNLVHTVAALSQLQERLQDTALFSFAIEEDGVGPHESSILGLSFATSDNDAYYVPLKQDQLIAPLDLSQIEEGLKSIFQSKAIKVAYDLKPKLKLLQTLDIDLHENFEDILLMAHLLEEPELALDQLTLKFLQCQKTPITELLGPKKDLPVERVPLQKLAAYACENSIASFRLKSIFSKKLSEAGLSNIYQEIELPFVSCLVEMEQAGICADGSYLKQLGTGFDSKLEELSRTIYDLAGEEFNINSPKQLQVILFEKLKIHEQMGLKKVKRTQSGYSTDSQVLESLKPAPLAEVLLEYRQLAKLRQTYTDALVDQINPISNRIHTSFKQTGTLTGRLSSVNPNLQNIPIRTAAGQQIRKAFTGASGQVLLSFDYSQIELRVLAHLSGDQNLINAFQAGLDIHIQTASLILEKDPADVTQEDRSAAKAINYGLVYGMGAQKLAKTTNKKVKEAQQFIEQYFIAFPGVRKFIDGQVELAEKEGYVRTLAGRKRTIKDISSSNGLKRAQGKNIAINTPIQGSAAELIKLSMLKVFARIKEKGLDARVVLQVHDELVVECAPQCVKEITELIMDAMENVMPLKVPLVVNKGQGENWLAAHS